MLYHIPQTVCITVISLHAQPVHQYEVQSVKDDSLHLPLIFISASLSGFTAESPLILIPALQRAVGEWFEKGVECFIPPCDSKVNYRCNQFHATRQRFYDVEKENGGLQFQSEWTIYHNYDRIIMVWLNLTVSSMPINWDNKNLEW